MKFPDPKHYPKKVYVASDAYTVQFVKGLTHFGDTDPEKYLIRIKEGMSKRETFCTIIHELLHAVEFSHNIDIKHKTVYELEKAIVELFIDNFLV